MKFINEDGIARVRVISPGQGSSAYYKEEQLARDVHAFDGGQVYVDHPGLKERKDRPERSLRDLVGPIIGTPTYDKNGPVGPGMYSEFRVAKHWRDFVEELGPAVSLRAGGKATTESIGGKQTKVAEKFNPGAGYDLVTVAGRGGKMVPLYEAATATADERVNEFMEAAAFVESDGRSEEARFMEWLDEPKGEGEPMELKEAQEKLTEAEGQVTTLTEANETLTTENARLAEALALRDARDIIVEAVSKNEELPEVTRTRLVETLTKSAPMKEGKLDKEALTTLIEDGIKVETDYIESLGPKVAPGIKGMGESGGSEDTAEMHEARVARKAAAYFAERKGTDEECKRMAELFYS